MNCPVDCEGESDQVRKWTLDNRNLNTASGASRLFGDKVAVVVEHPTYHCHQSYNGRMEVSILFLLRRHTPLQRP